MGLPTMDELCSFQHIKRLYEICIKITVEFVSTLIFVIFLNVIFAIWSLK